MDLSLLTDSEIELLEKLIAKAEGRFDGDVDVPFRIELVRQIVDTSAAEPTVHELKGLL